MHKRPKQIKAILSQLIQNIAAHPEQFSKNPQHDFTRTRKLGLKEIVMLLLGMKGGSTANELLDFFDYSLDTATTSAFVQQRSKLIPEAMETLFHSFVKKTSTTSLYKDFRLLAVDGSDIQIPTTKEDVDSFYPGTNGQKPYNLLHLNAMYDLLSHTYTDACVQKSHHANECRAFVDMVDRAEDIPTLFIADRGFEAFNNLAHIQEKGAKFLIRIKDVASCRGIASGLDLPDQDEFDVFISLLLSRKQTNADKELFKDRNHFRFISASAVFDYLPVKNKKSIPVAPYPLAFRIVRFPISDTTYETVITNLDEADFPSQELKKLYAMRWGIETSFRELKYTIGLLHFHAKKVEHILQEIFASLIMYNFCELITCPVVIHKANKKFTYKANFSVAVHICRQFLLKDISPPVLEALIAKNISPVRLGRSRPRKFSPKGAVSFLYRIA